MHSTSPLSGKIIARLHIAQAVPGMEQADPEMAPSEHVIYAPGFGAFESKSFKREFLHRVSDLQRAAQLDRWHDVDNISAIIDSMSKGMRNYMKGYTEPIAGEGNAAMATDAFGKRAATSKSA